jgi:hypothetical protein
MGMIEVRRDLYMSEADGRKTSRFTATRKGLGRMLERILPTDRIDLDAGRYGLTSP